MARLVGTQFLAAAVAFATAWQKLASTDIVVAIIAALAAGYGADTLKSVGAAVVNNVAGTASSPVEKQRNFATRLAELNED